jgi:branched-chain amino acid transport system ATP-binding protein
VFQDAGLRVGSITILDNVCLRIGPGGPTVLIGPNGSGKTTLFNCIVGFHPADRGSINFGGAELTGLSVPEIARLGLLRTFQQTHVYGGMTCTENMRVSVAHAGESLGALLRRFAPAVQERACHLLELVGLYDKRDVRADELSFGQRKLLEFAMALMSEPKMLLLDEPTAGINPTRINGVIGHLQRANAEFGITLLVIEHNMRVIMSLARHIYCLAHGQLLAGGRPDQIRADPRVVDAYLGAR